MLIRNRIKLSNSYYYISCECGYKGNKLYLYNNNDYFDNGDLSKLIKKVEESYNYELLSLRYNCDIKFIVDIIYIYECIPFIVGVGDLYFKDNIISSLSYMDIIELKKYITDNNIKLKDNSNFKLMDERTWDF